MDGSQPLDDGKRMVLIHEDACVANPSISFAILRTSFDRDSDNGDVESGNVAIAVPSDAERARAIISRTRAEERRGRRVHHFVGRSLEGSQSFAALVRREPRSARALIGATPISASGRTQRPRF
jgi:hypothetical protein